jgi:Putative polyhydroxyalkanoic acid system protein (PHA_gran_rgn).
MNKAVTVSIPHQLGRAEAKRRVDEGFGDFSRHLGGSAGALTKSWTGDRLNFSLQALGQGISGFLDVADDTVRVEVLLPGFLAMIAGKVKGTLQKEGQLLLGNK